MTNNDKKKFVKSLETMFDLAAGALCGKRIASFTVYQGKVAHP